MSDTLNSTSTEIYYANLLPGLGKTHWAIKRLVQCLQTREGIVLYVAPTIKLLEEVQQGVLRRFPTGEAHIKLLSSKTPTLDGVSVAQHLQLLLDGGEHRDGTRVVPVSEGSIILCTHEAFLRLPCHIHDIARRDLISVIFDEARKCTLREGDFSLDKEAFLKLRNEFLDINPAPGDFRRVRMKSGVNTNSNSFNSIFRAPKGQPRIQHKLSQMRSLILDTANPNVDLYSRFALTPSAEKKGEKCLRLHTILVPSRAFSGWKRVILLSAFFKYSQLYHLLCRGSVDFLDQLPKKEQARFLVDSEDTGHGPVKLIEAPTHSIVRKGRVEALSARYAKLHITYLSERTRFSMRLLKNGIILDDDGEKYSEQLSERFRMFNLTNRYKGKQGRNLHKLRNQWLEGTDEDAVNKIFEGIEKHPYMKYSPLQFYAIAATKLANAWHRKRGTTNPLPLLVSCNVGDSRLTYWNRDIEPILPILGPVCQVPFGCHGRNEWIGHDVLAFLSTINPSPTTRQLLQQLCPNYDTNLDYVVDQAVQTAMRMSVRDVTSDKPTLLIVTDKTLARAIKSHLGGLPKLIAPTKLLPQFKNYEVFAPSTVSELTDEQVHQRRARDRARKATRSPETTNLLAFISQNSKYYKEKNKLEVAATRCKKAGKPFAEAAKLAEFRAAFKAERRELVAKFKEQL